MTKEEILEGNKLIAEFIQLRGEYDEDKDLIYLESDIDGKGVYSFSELKYHTSWDWLMPCIGKISNVCEEPEELDELKYALLTNNIEEAWKFVVNYLTIS